MDDLKQKYLSAIADASDEGALEELRLQAVGAQTVSGPGHNPTQKLTYPSPSPQILFANWQPRPDNSTERIVADIMDSDFTYAAGRIKSFMAPIGNAFVLV